MRPDWNSVFIAIAIEVSKRSHDLDTKFGSVLVTSTNEIIATGYNGFVRDIDDTVFPLTRPDKYEFLLHSEYNCLLNCARQGRPTLNTTMYITGAPCLLCLQSMYQAGVVHVKYADISRAKMLDNPNYKKNVNLFLRLTQNKFFLEKI